jgi:hypothetical protein
MNQTLIITSEQRASMQRARDVLDEVTRLDAAIAAKDADISAAERKCDDAWKALAERDADFALATDEAAMTAIEQDIQKLHKLREEARDNLDRQKRIRAALLNRLAGAEADVVAERAVFQGVVQEHRGDVLSAMAIEVAQAARPLIEALHRYVIASVATGSSAAHRLASMELPDLRNNGYLLFGTTQAAYLDGVQVKLTDLGDDLALHELHRVLSEPNRVLMAFDSRASRIERHHDRASAQGTQSRSEA